MMASYGTRSGGQHAHRQLGDGSQARSQDIREALSDSQCCDLIDLILNTVDCMEDLLCPRAEPEMKGSLSHGNALDSGKEDVDLLGGETGQPQRPKRPVRSATTVAAIKAEAEASRHFGSWRDAVLARVREALQGQNGRAPLQPMKAQQSLIDLDEGGLGQQDCALQELPSETKDLIVNSLLLILLSLEHYNAHSRVLLVRVALQLGLQVADVSEHEIKVAHVLLDSVKEMNHAEEELKRRAEQSKISRRWKVKLASVAGAALIGVTGGLAAPLVAAGVGTILGGLGLGATVAAGYLGAVAGSTIIIGGLFGAYGAKMSGRMMDRYAREVEDFAFLPLGSTPKPASEPTKARPPSSDNRLRVTIGISGWLTEGKDVIEPWRVLGPDSDVFALRWELQALLRLGSSLTTFVRNTAWTFAGRTVLSKTALAPVVGAVMLPVTISKISYILDNPFNVAKVRADKAGQILADALINKAQGERSVTLIGYSLGARVIFSCLIALAKRRAFGLVESAILIGSPTPSTTSHWRLMRSVVSGRLVNVYSENDGILQFLYRANSMQLDIAGLEAISGIQEVENYDVTGIVSGHLQYQFSIGKILQRIGFDHLDEREIQRQEHKLEINEEEMKNLEEERIATARAAQTSGTATKETAIKVQEGQPRTGPSVDVSSVALAGALSGAATATTGIAATAGTAVDGADGDHVDDTDDEAPARIMMVDNDGIELDDSSDTNECPYPDIEPEQLERDIEEMTRQRLLNARMDGIQLEDNY
ncbi:hypothetical protein H112_05785 [Trichophyton rubrum D6]|uniref:DUF726 domain-containing protein n=3 Tax=Trichophyton rubrum TaxID=5551 RepID=A0A080WFX5_TRIRC|nr:uncharacterized protein TERG_12007 [Trichophyton rubrum CBS 118892]EZF16348.1 hypothetical protein H100_05802 [Trichophyton rubrum MR850]EZF40218.1 hypothetical protein H102_05771 [Trichophyton rubrum CBS 100081]EZF50991.1 hypothetical protein H103_05797 [Trichophyton rubrum CBS 288.86]EZF82817.1 hypothetical protein H110_05790 [Trichophyton rubrum MR1448]EZF93679.1 hypothetical protein H113_05839 [Trichophyton rubrum MR1459]EZG15292.1 hypothetical protein H107_05933 [Trichophyton rubrum C